MKRLAKTEKVIGNNVFYINPFAAFTAAYVSAELTSVLSPMIGSMGAAVGNIKMTDAMKAANGLPTGDGDAAEEAGSITTADIMNMDMESLMPAIGAAFSSLSGDKLECLMRRLLVDYANISVQGEETDGRTVVLNKDLADEIFCGEIQDMFILCYEVIKVNFSGFFKKLGAQFGRQLRAMAAEKSASTASST